ncbi:SGNH hydrolase [Corynespora cassiicola Philippines]|uniref:SGNH hydrolase n=1 Tax=Corynespora cassiicola Philippines TaxID=1448308 RepID=A0A2T2NDX4_CORCC|nr:SGNH hydrolase [Corynespora cassiicola Philippines]
MATLSGLPLGGPRVRLFLKAAFVFVATCLILPFALPAPQPRYHLPRTTISQTPLRILPLGDSITWGWQPAHQQSGTNGYRAQLLARLAQAGNADVDFVGTQRSGDMEDADNEGHSGFTIAQVRGVMDAGLEFAPNVVLVHAGTNDLNREEGAEGTWAEAPNRLGEIVDRVVEQGPDTVVLVAKIIQAENNRTAENIARFNKAVKEVVGSRLTLGYNVMVVDHSVVGVGELVDGLHPTDAGYAHMGDIWFEGLKLAAEQGLIRPPV